MRKRARLFLSLGSWFLSSEVRNFYGICFFYKRSDQIVLVPRPRSELMHYGWMKNVMHNDLNDGFQFLLMVSVALCYLLTC